jgi:hypothetical protein
MTLFEMKGNHPFSVALFIDSNTFKRYEIGATDGTDASTTKLSSVASEPGAFLTVTYDFGGGWVVLLKLEKVFEDPGTGSPWAIQVLEGERFGIVEDRGGTDKLERLAEAYKIKKGESYDELYEMIGKDESSAQHGGIDYEAEIGAVEYGKVKIAPDAAGRIDFSEVDYADYGNIDALGKIEFSDPNQGWAAPAPAAQSFDFGNAEIGNEAIPLFGEIGLSANGQGVDAGRFKKIDAYNGAAQDGRMGAGNVGRVYTPRDSGIDAPIDARPGYADPAFGLEEAGKAEKIPYLTDEDLERLSVR